MGSDDGQGRGLSKFATRVGKVAAAAAALLAEGTAEARADDLLANVLNRSHAVASAPPAVEAEAGRSVPPPLVLRPSLTNARLIRAGHRSHSSHSSHRSHVSGSGHSSHVSASSHSSHYSSSTRSGSGYRSSSPTYVTPSVPADPSTPSGVPSQPASPAWAEPAPAPRVETAPPIDLNDPSQRYRLITVGWIGGARKAFIKDQLAGVSKLMTVGEKIGDCQLVSIAIETMSVRLKPTKGPEVTIYRNPVTKK